MMPRTASMESRLRKIERPLAVSPENPFIRKIGEHEITHENGQKEKLVVEQLHYVPGFAVGKKGYETGERTRDTQTTSGKYQQEARNLLAKGMGMWRGYFPFDERTTAALFHQEPKVEGSNLKSTIMTIRSLNTGKVIGMTTASKAVGEGEHRNFLLEYILLNPEYRKHKLGNILLNKQMEIGKEQGAKLMTLETERYTPEMARLHDRLKQHPEENPKELTRLNDLENRLKAFAKMGVQRIGGIQHYHTLSANNENPLGTPLWLHVKPTSEETKPFTREQITKAQLALYTSGVYETPELGKKIYGINTRQPQKAITLGKGSDILRAYQQAVARKQGTK